MGGQLISFRLRDEEVALLMQHANPEENPNATAQRLIRQLLGIHENSPGGLTSLLTQVNDFQEQVESVKSFVNDVIDERLDAVDGLVGEAVSQQMTAEKLKIRSRFDELDQRLGKYFRKQRESVISLTQQQTVTTRPTHKSQLPNQPLNHSELAQRLINPKSGHAYSLSAISRQKERVDFSDWSKQRDPQGIAWMYEAKDGLFYPLESY